MFAVVHFAKAIPDALPKVSSSAPQDQVNTHVLDYFHGYTRITKQTPDDATLQDRKRLQEEYGIKTIMDLRTV